MLIALCALSYAAISDGKIVEENLETMVHESKLIILGKVASVEFTGQILTDEFKIGKWNSCKAVIKPDLVIKGRLQQDELDLYYIGGMSTEARFNLNDTSIFFVDEDDQGRLATVRGYAGKVDITQQVAMPVAIRNEENPQPLDAFIRKIRAIVEVGSVSLVKKEDAIEVANKEVEKLGIDLRDLEVEVDKGNRRWDEVMSIMGLVEMRALANNISITRQNSTAGPFGLFFIAPNALMVMDGKGAERPSSLMLEVEKCSL